MIGRLFPKCGGLLAFEFGNFLLQTCNHAAHLSQLPLNVTWPDLPAEIQDRDADIWEGALVAVADAVGGEWPEARQSGSGSVGSGWAGTRPEFGRSDCSRTSGWCSATTP